MRTAARQQSTRVVAIAALAAAVAAIAALVVLSGPGSYRVSAVFSQVYGLVAGAKVQAAGLNVGSVNSITLNRQGLPLVSMSIDDSYRLRAGASASVQAFSVTGEYNRFITLTQGSGRPLADGATLPLRQTSTPVEIYQLLDTLDPRTRAQVRGMLANLDASLAGEGPNLQGALAHSARALGNTAALLAEVDSDGVALRNFVRYGSALVATLASRPARLRSLADAMAQVLAATAARQRQLAAVDGLLYPGLRAPTQALARVDRSIGVLARFVNQARPAARELVPFSHALAPALVAAPATLRQANSLLASAPGDVRALSPLVLRLHRLLPALHEDLSQANPALDVLRVRLPDVFSFFANWADFTADYDANGHGARVGLVLPPAPSNPVGPCSEQAGSLRFPFLRAPGVLGGDPWRDYAKSFIGGGPAQPGGC